MDDSSVLGKLMGLNELQPHEYAKNHQRALSEKYLQGINSIGVQEKRFSRECSSFKMRLNEQKELKNLYVLERQRFCFDSSSKLKRRKTRNHLDSDLCKFSRPAFELKENASFPSKRIPFLKPKTDFDFFQNEGFYSDLKKKNMSPRPNVENKESKSAGYKMEYTRQTSRLSREISYWTRKRTRHLSANSYDYNVIETPRNQNRFEVSKNRWFLGKHESDTWLQHRSMRLIPKKLQVDFDKVVATDHLMNKVVGIDLSDHGYQSLKSRIYRSGTQFSRTKRKKWTMNKSLENEPKADNLFKRQSSLLNSSSLELQEHDDSSSYLTNTSIQQAGASTGLQEEGSVFSHCSDTVPDSLVSLDDVYQSSPVSVLQSLCKEETSSGAQSMKKLGIDGGDLRLQLELLTCSEDNKEEPGMNVSSDEEPAMNVSSDEDSEGESVRKFSQNEDIKSFFKSEDSRDFSYLVDVLTDVSFHGKSLELGFCNWASLECPISISVFETLEKKFGEQMDWKRSERKLLFDQINLGLVEILQSFICLPKWANPAVSRRFRNWPSEEALEEALWILIDDQKKEMSKNLLGKSLDLELWKLDFGDNVDAICRELVSSMMDELVVEFVTLKIIAQ